MTQEKLRRVVTAVVVAGTTLFVILLSVLIYQWIKIAVYNSRIEKLEEENKQIEAEIENSEEALDYYNSDIGKFWLAMEKGFILGQRK